MSWHYRIRHSNGQYGKRFDIVEYYEEQNAWTTRGIAPWATSKRELIQMLERMLKDAKSKPVVKDWV